MSPVIFKYEGEEVVAFFPTLPGTNDPSTLTCYAHIGQHASASMDNVRDCKPAKPKDYKPLLKELRAIGYDNLKVRKRMSQKDFEIRKKELNQCQNLS